MKYTVASIIFLSFFLTPPVLAKKTQPKPAAIVQLIAPGADRTDPVRDAMFKAAFGKDAPTMRTIEAQDYSFSPEAVQSLGGDMFALISMGQNENDGHASSGMNAIHYVRKTTSGYIKVGEWFDIGAAATFGAPALSYGFTNKLGRNAYLVTQAGGTWQGTTCEWTYLTELTPEKPFNSANFASFYSNSGAVEEGSGKEESIESVIISAIPDKSFAVSFSGSRKFTQNWVHNGSQGYKMKKGKELPIC